MLTTRPWLAPLLLVLAGCAVYANGFTDIFAGLDAKESIRDNPHIRQLWPLSESMSLGLLDETLSNDEGSKGGTLVRRPFLSLTFALNYAVLGAAPWGFQAVNLLIHLTVGLLLFGIVRRTLLRLGFAEDHGRGVALAAAFLWVVHPLHTEAVTNIAQRAESLMGMLYLITLYGAVRGFEAADERRKWWGMAAIASAIGMGVKETMVTAPVLVLLYDYTFVSARITDLVRRHWKLYGALFATWLVLVALIATTAEDASRDFADGKTLPYLISQPRVILHYLRLAVWPDELHIYVNTKQFAYIPGVSVRSTFLIPAMVIVTALVAALWTLFRRSRFGFLAASFFLILAPTSSVVATSDVLQEHRMYLSLAVLIVAAVVCADGMRQRLAKLQPQLARPAVAGAVILLLALALGARTHARNRDYHTEFGSVHPTDMRQALIIVARHEFAQDNIDRAVELFDSALAFLPDTNSLAEAHYDLGNLFFERGRYSEAQLHFNEAVRANSAIAAAHNNLGVLLALESDYDGAAHHFRLATEYNPRHGIAFGNLGIAEVERGNFEEAITNLETATDWIPRFQAARQELYFLEIRMAAPDDPPIRYALSYKLTQGYRDAYLVRDHEEPLEPAQE